jgi:hypothetical protein
MIDGKLDTTKLPLELLEGFGYRIPTSGINLMILKLLDSYLSPW